MKNKVIIFEGVDKTGKSTIINKLNSQNNYKYWILDRSCISSLVYDKLFKRNNEAYWINVVKELFNTYDVKLFYCNCDNDVIIRRLNDANETLPDELVNINKVKETFLYYLEKLNLDYLIIDTNQNIDRCIKEIVDHVEDK